MKIKAIKQELVSSKTNLNEDNIGKQEEEEEMQESNDYDTRERESQDNVMMDNGDEDDDNINPSEEEEDDEYLSNFPLIISYYFLKCPTSVLFHLL